MKFVFLNKEEVEEEDLINNIVRSIAFNHISCAGVVLVTPSTLTLD
jgi:hypothetical protein